MPECSGMRAGSFVFSLAGHYMWICQTDASTRKLDGRRNPVTNEKGSESSVRNHQKLKRNECESSVYCRACGSAPAFSLGFELLLSSRASRISDAMVLGIAAIWGGGSKDGHCERGAPKHDQDRGVSQFRFPWAFESCRRSALQRTQLS